MGKLVLIVIALSATLLGADYGRPTSYVPAAIQEDAVELSRSTYSPGDTAAFLIKDLDLNRIQTCTAAWIDLVADEENLIPENTLWSLVTGAPQPLAFAGISDGCQYDTSTPANTPLPFSPRMQVTVNQLENKVDDLRPDSGEFSINQEISEDGSDLVAEFFHEAVDVYQASSTRARVTSTSDAEGEWVGFSEVSEEDHNAPNPTSALFLGEVSLSPDQSAKGQGDRSVFVETGDIITVEYMDESGTMVISSDQSQVTEPTPTPTPIPSANLISLLVLAGAFAIVFLWKRNRRFKTFR